MAKTDSLHVHDVVVVGGGPAGISCALECHESGLDVVLLERSDRVGGQTSLIPSAVYNYAAGYFENGEALRDEMENVAKLFLSDRLKTGCNVLNVDLDTKEVDTNHGTYRGKTIFLATGYRLKQLDLPIPNDYVEDVYYRSGIHSETLRDKEVVIIGGGDSAVFTALDLAEHCQHVTVLARASRLKARPDIVARMNHHKHIEVHTNSVVKKLLGHQHLESVLVANAESEFEIKCSKLIAKLGYLPNTELFANQLESSDGHVLVDQTFATSIKGVFAGGDIAQPGYDRIAFAAGSGMMAAHSIRVFLGHTP